MHILNKACLAALCIIAAACKGNKNEQHNSGGKDTAAVQHSSSVKDTAAAVQTLYNDTLTYQRVTFMVKADKRGDSTVLAVSTRGLPYEFNERMHISAVKVTGAQVADLNADGSPELLIYTAGPGSRRGIEAFSVNNTQSMSMATFHPAQDNAKINAGYAGNDVFSIEDNVLVQRFPVVGTDKVRIIRYKLTDGEASRIFEVQSVQ